MAFKQRHLSVLSYANGFTHWHYRADGETLDDTQRPGYFFAVKGEVLPGDLITISARDGVGQYGALGGSITFPVRYGTVQVSPIDIDA